MIELEPETACVLYMGLATFVVFGAWIYSNYKNKTKVSHQNPFEGTHCEFCAFSYLIDPVKDFSRCPQCGNINKK